MLLLLLSCARDRTPDPYVATATLPLAEHAVSYDPLDALWVVPREREDKDEERLWRWSRGEVSSQEMLSRGELALAAVDVGPDAVRLDGQVVVALEEGHIRPEELKGTLSVPLFEALLDRAEESKRYERFDGHLLLFVDARLPYDTVRQVLYTAGQAQYSEFAFAVSDPAPEARSTSAPESTDRVAQVWLSPSGSQVGLGWDGEVREGGLDSLATQERVGCGLLIPEGAVPWSRVTDALDAFYGLDAPDVLMAGGAYNDPPVAVPGLSSGVPRQVSPLQPIPVLETELPPIGPVERDGDCGGPIYRPIVFPPLTRE